jgi:xylulose-5-phosphate/fructose-6-phosphate phosphoketolase
MTVLHRLHRFQLVMDAADRVPQLAYRTAHLKQAMRDRLIEHRAHITRHGKDMPMIRDWRWGQNEENDA